MYLGLENFFQKEFKKYQDLRLGVLANPASVDRSLRHIRDLVFDKKYKLRVTCFFGPQHGIRAEKQDDMKESEDFIDPVYNIPVYSLYADTREPTPRMLEKIDAFLVDLQDIGCRIYTYMYTLANCMVAAKRANKKVIVLDRPNPIDGVTTEGNVLEKEFASFVGQYPLCTRHGMTMGELACLFNNAFEIGCDLEIVRLKGWKRDSQAPAWKRDWIQPSPNLPNFKAALLFSGIVHFEGTHVSEGRGTTRPFEWVGAPFIDPDVLAKEMNSLKLKGIYFRPIYFQPTYQKCKDRVCGGVQLHVTETTQFNSFLSGLSLLQTIAKLYPGKFEWKKPPYEYETVKLPIDIISGTSKIRESVDRGTALTEFYPKACEELKTFRKLRKAFLIY